MNAIFGILSMNEIPFYTELMIFRELHVFFFDFRGAMTPNIAFILLSSLVFSIT